MEQYSFIFVNRYFYSSTVSAVLRLWSRSGLTRAPDTRGPSEAHAVGAGMVVPAGLRAIDTLLCVHVDSPRQINPQGSVTYLCVT